MLRPLAALLLLGPCTLAQPGSPAARPAAAAATPDLLHWSTVATQPNRYVSAHGLRAFAGGYAEDGLEFWSFPLQIVSGYQLSFTSGDTAPVSGLLLLSSVEVDPEGFTRTYTAPDFRVHERVATHARDAGTLVRFTVEGRHDVSITAHFHPSLNLMWPAGIGGQETGWDDTSHGFLLSEPTHHFQALIASPAAREHSEINNDRRNSTFDRLLSMTLHPQAGSQTGSPACPRDAVCADLVLAGESDPGEDVHATAASLLRFAAAPPEPADRHTLLPEAIEITTPDPDANKALRWAQIDLDQAWTCNPRLGCALVAGYGPSHGSRRPQYEWFFAGDGLVATEALLHEGAFDRAAAELDFLFRYQNPANGMMWHEISQSAGFLHWAEDYPYLYVHVDITFDFLVGLADYARITGDEAFIRRHWEAIQRAYSYCTSTLDSRDGLPRVPSDKMSGNEQDRLTDEITLSAAWVRAARAMSELSTLMHDPTLAHSAADASERARQSVGSRYWNAKTKRWVSGFTRTGAPAESTSAAGLAAIASGAATPAQASLILDELATPPFLTSWGLRSKPSDAPDYDPTAYSRGSVWALGTADAANVLWHAHRAGLASTLWMDLVPWDQVDSLGHMHEVMSGAFFTPQRESVPEQTWSSAAFLSAALDGMLGLEVDAAKRRLHLSPQPPASWNSLEVSHVRVGTSTLDLAWHKTGTGFSLDVTSQVLTSPPMTSGGKAGTTPPLHITWTQAAPEDQPGQNPIVAERDIIAEHTRIELPLVSPHRER